MRYLTVTTVDYGQEKCTHFIEQSFYRAAASCISKFMSVHARINMRRRCYCNIYRGSVFRSTSSSVSLKDTCATAPSISPRVEIVQTFPNGVSRSYALYPNSKELSGESSIISSLDIDKAGNGVSSDRTHWLQWPRHVADGVVRTFLPKGYPKSVNKGYSKFVQGQILGGVFSSAGGVLSMQALLYAVGLGAGSIPLAGALNWVIKDGLGQLGGVLCSSLVNNKFDAHPKRWRFAANLIMDCSSFIELLSPLAPQYFIAIASLANIGKNISCLAASASRAAIHHSFAISENLADVTAKSGSQSILASTIGTGLGISIATLISDNYAATVFAFASCSLLGLLSTSWSLRHVALSTLSVDRFHFIYAKYRGDVSRAPVDIYSKIPVATPKQLCDEERFLDIREPKEFVAQIVRELTDRTEDVESSKLCPIVVGSKFVDVFHDKGYPIQDHLNLFHNDRYILKIAVPHARRSQSGCSVHVLLKEGAQLEDIAAAYVHAFEVRYALAARGEVAGSDPWKLNEELINRAYANIRKTDKNGTRMIDDFLRKLLAYESGTPSDVKPNNDSAELNTGYSAMWHVNPLLLEPNFARVAIASK